MPRGRTRKIETQDALHAIMLAFWKNGYKATSMSDLSEASGMAKPGLYAAFGDKEDMFEKSLLHYFKTIGGPVFAELQQARKNVIDDFRDFLRAVAVVTAGVETPSGCFLVNALIDCSYGSERLSDLVNGLRESRFMAIKDRILKGVGAGELLPDTDVDRAATFMDGQFSAIAMLGRSGSSIAELDLFIETGLSALPVVDNAAMFVNFSDSSTLQQ
ncbi:MAG: TetR/AcrR family transcriptional regulator [Roseibium sp.]